MPDMMFPIIVLVIIGFLILSFLIHLFDIIDIDKNNKITESIKDDENE